MTELLIHLDRNDSFSDNRKTFCGIKINQLLDESSKNPTNANCPECKSEWRKEKENDLEWVSPIAL